jgi:hypothetical protein
MSLRPVWAIQRVLISKKKKKKVRNGMPEIPALGRPKQEDCELEASLGYILRP